jgi:hypothetical protein
MTISSGQQDVSCGCFSLASMIARNSNGMIGPSLAGMIISIGGEGFCFLSDGISYLAVIAALLAMRVPPQNNGRSDRPILGESVADASTSG